MAEGRQHALTLLTVMGHPDDETVWAGGVMARYAAEGLRVVCVTCTGGENGTIVAPELDTPENRAHLGEIRAQELARALGRLGPIESRQLGFGDSGMMGSPANADPRSFWQADPEEATGRLVRVVREIQADVIVTFNEAGGTGHPDHIRAAAAARAAFARAGEASAYPEQCLGDDAVSPWTPSKLYERRMTTSRRKKIFRLVAAEGLRAAIPIILRFATRWRPSMERRRMAKDRAQGPMTTEVDVSRWVSAKEAAMAEHHTQIIASPGYLRYLAVRSEQFTLRETRVEVQAPETDLFAGLRPLLQRDPSGLQGTVSGRPA